VRRSGARGCRVSCFWVEISRNVWLDSMIPRDFVDVYNGLELMC
jgi:hypothetical protein